jgi:caa(3)-type oxidase subunit IV
MSTEHVVPIRLYLIVFTTLVVLTGVTTAVAFVDLGALNVVVMLLIAFFKASLVILFFMHRRRIRLARGADRPHPDRRPHACRRALTPSSLALSSRSQ